MQTTAELKIMLSRRMHTRSQGCCARAAVPRYWVDSVSHRSCNCSYTHNRYFVSEIGVLLEERREKNGSCAAPNACVLTWVMSIGCVCTLYAGNGCPCHFPLRLHTAAAPCAVAVAHTSRYSMVEIAAFPRFLGLGRQKSRSSPLSAPILDEKLMNGGEKRRY